MYFCARDFRSRYYVRVLALSIVAYAFSPIDLIPDFIPVIGLLDDLVIIPLGVALIMRLTPPEIIDSARQKAEHVSTQPTSYIAALFIVVIWLTVLALFIQWMLFTPASDPALRGADKRQQNRIG